MDLREIITIEPGKKDGKPCIRHMRITVQDILEYLASGMTIDKIRDDFHPLPGMIFMLVLVWLPIKKARKFTANEIFDFLNV